MSASQPAKQDRPVDATMITISRRQHAGAADKIAARIAICANTVRKHLADGQPAGPAARQIATDVMELIAELAKLSEAGRFAQWTQQPATVKARKAAA